MRNTALLLRAQEQGNPLAAKAVNFARRHMEWRRRGGAVVPFLLGETGINNRDAASRRRLDQAGEALLKEWQREIARNPNTWVTLWEVGPAVGSAGELGLITDKDVSEGGSGVKGMTLIRPNWWVPRKYMSANVGVNYAGGEYMGNAGTLWGSGNWNGGLFSDYEGQQGVAGIDYFLPGRSSNTLNDFPIMAANGIKLVRLPIRMERLLTGLGGDLREAKALEIDAVLDDAQTYGMKIILDAHNYVSYWQGTDASTRTARVLTRTGGVFTAAHLASFWIKCLQRWGSHPSLLGVDIMNEPSVTGMPTATENMGTIASFDAGTESWVHVSGITGGGDSWGHNTTVDADKVYAGAGSLRVTKEFTNSGFSAFQLREPFSAGRSRPGPDIAYRLYVPNTGTKAFQARVLIYDPAQSTAGTGTGTTRNVTKGAWNLISYTPPAGLLANHQAVGLQVWTTTVDTLQTYTVYIDEVASYESLTGYRQWELCASDVADAIAAEGLDTVWCFLTTYGTSVWSLNDGAGSAWHHPMPWSDSDHAMLAYTNHSYPFDINETGNSVPEYGLVARDAKTRNLDRMLPGY